jgi:phage/plasmid-associated DNA primase
VVLKAVTGGDATNIRAAASPDSIDVIFSCVPVLATNSMCELVDPVFKNRLLCINFCNTFKRDGTFKTNLLDRKDEFFTHLVKYCVQFFKTNTITMCDEIKSFTQVIKDDNYPFRMWVTEQDSFVKGDSDEVVPREEVLYSYLNYCRSNQYTPLGRTKAYEKISSHFGLTAERRLVNGDRTWVYVGLARSED